MNRILFFVAAMLFMTVGRLPAGDGFGEPERLMRAFCRHLGEGDFAAASRLFDAVTAARLNPAMQTLRTRVIDKDSFTRLVDHPAYAGLDEEATRNKYLVQIRFFVTSLLGTEEYPQMAELRPQRLASGDALKEMAETLNPARMKNLAVARMDPVMPGGMTADEYADVLEGLNAAFGLEEYREYLMLYELDGAYFLGGATLYKRDGGWRIANLYCPAKADVFGQYDVFVPEITMSEYEGFVSNP